MPAGAPAARKPSTLPASRSRAGPVVGCEHELAVGRYRVGSTQPNRSPMSFLARFTPVSVTVEKYEESIRRLEEGDFDWPPDGLEYHVCFGPADNIRVSEIWASE